MPVTRATKTSRNRSFPLQRPAAASRSTATSVTLVSELAYGNSVSPQPGWVVASHGIRMRDDRVVRIELVGMECPVLPGVTVGVQRGSEVVDERPANGELLTWQLDVRVVEGAGDLRGPYVHGRPGARFLYMSWLRPPAGMFRRAKLMLNEVPAALLAEDSGSGVRGLVRLAMSDGTPLCAAVRPPVVTWSAL